MQDALPWGSAFFYGKILRKTKYVIEDDYNEGESKSGKRRKKLLSVKIDESKIE